MPALADAARRQRRARSRAVPGPGISASSTRGSRSVVASGSWAQASHALVDALGGAQAMQKSLAGAARRIATKAIEGAPGTGDGTASRDERGARRPRGQVRAAARSGAARDRRGCGLAPDGASRRRAPRRRVGPRALQGFSISSDHLRPAPAGTGRHGAGAALPAHPLPGPRIALASSGRSRSRTTDAPSCGTRGSPPARSTSGRTRRRTFAPSGRRTTTSRTSSASSTRSSRSA